MNKSEGKKASEKAIMDKIQSIFDNADYLDEFEITVKGGIAQCTTIEYKVAERIYPRTEEEPGFEVCPFE